MKKNIKINTSKEKKNFDKYLKKLLNKTLDKNYLNKVILYSSLNGGKRIRPYLVKQFAAIKTIKPSYYYRLSVVVELIHSYSLLYHIYV